MPNNIENVIKIFDKLKESLKFHYDYHKHMTTINAGAILLIITILEGVFKEPKGIGIIMSSIVFFVLSLTCSLKGMTTITEITLTMTAIHLALFKKNVKEFEEISDSSNFVLSRLRIIDKLHRIFFFLGIVLLVCFAFINFL